MPETLAVLLRDRCTHSIVTHDVVVEAADGAPNAVPGSVFRFLVGDDPAAVQCTLAVRTASGALRTTTNA